MLLRCCFGGSVAPPRQAVLGAAEQPKDAPASAASDDLQRFTQAKREQVMSLYPKLSQIKGSWLHRIKATTELLASELGATYVGVSCPSSHGAAYLVIAAAGTCQYKMPRGHVIHLHMQGAATQPLPGVPNNPYASTQLRNSVTNLGPTTQQLLKQELIIGAPTRSSPPINPARLVPAVASMHLLHSPSSPLRPAHGSDAYGAGMAGSSMAPQRSSSVGHSAHIGMGGLSSAAVAGGAAHPGHAPLPYRSQSHRLHMGESLSHVPAHSAPQQQQRLSLAEDVRSGPLSQSTTDGQLPQGHHQHGSSGPQGQGRQQGQAPPPRTSLATMEVTQRPVFWRQPPAAAAPVPVTATAIAEATSGLVVGASVSASAGQGPSPAASLSACPASDTLCPLDWLPLVAGGSTDICVLPILHGNELVGALTLAFPPAMSGSAAAGGAPNSNFYRHSTMHYERASSTSMLQTHPSPSTTQPLVTMVPGTGEGAAAAMRTLPVSGSMRRADSSSAAHMQHTPSSRFRTSSAAAAGAGGSGGVAHATSGLAGASPSSAGATNAAAGGTSGSPGAAGISGSGVGGPAGWLQALEPDLTHLAHFLAFGCFSDAAQLRLAGQATDLVCALVEARDIQSLVSTLVAGTRDRIASHLHLNVRVVPALLHKSGATAAFFREAQHPLARSVSASGPCWRSANMGSGPSSSAIGGVQPAGSFIGGTVGIHTSRSLNKLVLADEIDSEGPDAYDPDRYTQQSRYGTGSGAHLHIGQGGGGGGSSHHHHHAAHSMGLQQGPLLKASVVSVAATLLSEVLAEGRSRGGKVVPGAADTAHGGWGECALSRDVVLCHRIVGFRPESLAVAVGYAPLGGASSAAQVNVNAGAGGPAGGGGGGGMHPAHAQAQAAHMQRGPLLALYCCSRERLPRPVLGVLLDDVRALIKLVIPAVAERLRGRLQEEWWHLSEVLMAPAALAAQGATGPLGGLYSAPRRQPLAQMVLSAQASSHGGTHDMAGSSAMLDTGNVDWISEQWSVSKSSLSFPLEEPPHLGQLGLLVGSIHCTLSGIAVERHAHTGTDVQEEAVDDLFGIELLQQIGQGGQGVVFRGVMHSLVVAIKVVPEEDEGRVLGSPCGAVGLNSPGASGYGSCDAEEAVMRKGGQQVLRDALELAVTSALSHPNILQLYTFFTDVLVVEYEGESGRYRLLRREDAGAQYAASRGNTVIILEYGDAGTLKDVIQRGVFKIPRTSNTALGATVVDRPNLWALYTTLLEIALALRHLHSHSLVHCDLKPSNVLLKYSKDDPRGFTTRLGDFGCAKILSEVSEDGRAGFSRGQRLGTLSHMAPEVFGKVQAVQLLDAQIDVYALGVTMWEMYTGQPVYPGVPSGRIPQRTRSGMRPPVPDDMVPEYRSLMVACWSPDARRRPTSRSLINILRRRLASLDPTAQGLPTGTTPVTGVLSARPGHHRAAAAGAGGATANMRPLSERYTRVVTESAASHMTGSTVASAAQVGMGLTPGGGPGGLARTASAQALATAASNVMLDTNASGYTAAAAAAAAAGGSMAGGSNAALSGVGSSSTLHSPSARHVHMGGGRMPSSSGAGGGGGGGGGGGAQAGASSLQTSASSLGASIIHSSSSHRNLAPGGAAGGPAHPSGSSAGMGGGGGATSLANSQQMGQLMGYGTSQGVGAGGSSSTLHGSVMGHGSGQMVLSAANLVATASGMARQSSIQSMRSPHSSQAASFVSMGGQGAASASGENGGEGVLLGQQQHRSSGGGGGGMPTPVLAGAAGARGAVGMAGVGARSGRRLSWQMPLDSPPPSSASHAAMGHGTAVAAVASGTSTGLTVGVGPTSSSSNALYSRSSGLGPSGANAGDSMGMPHGLDMDLRTHLLLSPNTSQALPQAGGGASSGLHQAHYQQQQQGQGQGQGQLHAYHGQQAHSSHYQQQQLQQQQQPYSTSSGQQYGTSSGQQHITGSQQHLQRMRVSVGAGSSASMARSSDLYATFGEYLQPSPSLSMASRQDRNNMGGGGGSDVTSRSHGSGSIARFHSGTAQGWQQPHASEVANMNPIGGFGRSSASGAANAVYGYASGNGSGSASNSGAPSQGQHAGLRHSVSLGRAPVVPRTSASAYGWNAYDAGAGMGGGGGGGGYDPAAPNATGAGASNSVGQTNVNLGSGSLFLRSRFSLDRAMGAASMAGGLRPDPVPEEDMQSLASSARASSVGPGGGSSQAGVGGDRVGGGSSRPASGHDQQHMLLQPHDGPSSGGASSAAPSAAGGGGGAMTMGRAASGSESSVPFMLSQSGQASSYMGHTGAGSAAGVLHSLLPGGGMLFPSLGGRESVASARLSQGLSPYMYVGPTPGDDRESVGIASAAGLASAAALMTLQAPHSTGLLHLSQAHLSGPTIHSHSPGPSGGGGSVSGAASSPFHAAGMSLASMHGSSAGGAGATAGGMHASGTMPGVHTGPATSEPPSPAISTYRTSHGTTFAAAVTISNARASSVGHAMSAVVEEAEGAASGPLPGTGSRGTRGSAEDGGSAVSLAGRLGWL